MTSNDQHPADQPDPWAPASSSQDSAGAPGAGASGAGARPRRRGLFIAAMVIFGIGVLFTIAAAATPFILDREAPTFLYLGAMFFTPIGFLLGLLYAILGSRPPKS